MASKSGRNNTRPAQPTGGIYAAPYETEGWHVVPGWLLKFFIDKLKMYVIIKMQERVGNRHATAETTYM